MVNKNEDLEKWKASVTVEAALVMPLVLSCIVLLLVMNCYLHDIVVLNGLITEVLYAELSETESETFLKQESESRLILLKSVEFTQKENLLTRTISWEKNYSLPVSGFLSLVIENTSVGLSGADQKQTWKMSSIVRYGT